MQEKSEADKKEEIKGIKKGGTIDGVGYDKALSEAVFAMKEGEMKVVTTDNGVYLVKETKHVPFKAAVFGEVKGRIAADYTNEKADEKITALKNEKRNSVKVEIFDEKIKNTIK
jgi:phosphosulfolactate phosphohydrolase-like enzyme